MQIKFTPVTQHCGGVKVSFQPDATDTSNKMIYIDGIKKPLILPRGIYCRYIKEISLNVCNTAICVSYNLVEMLNLYNEELEQDLRNQVGFQEVSDDDIDFTFFAGIK
jgi:hypothetical protein